MGYAIIIKEEAETDIRDAYNWYESKQTNLGDDFIEELEKYLKILKRNPKIYQIRKSNRRYCPLKRFPYLVVYEIEAKYVVVYAIFNSYQHPSRLKNR